MEISFDYNIIKHVGTLSVTRINNSRWTKELNVISWNGKEPKFDIRMWNSDHTMMKNGITLTRDEIRKVFKLLEKSEEAI